MDRSLVHNRDRSLIKGRGGGYKMGKSLCMKGTDVKQMGLCGQAILQILSVILQIQAVIRAIRCSTLRFYLM